MHKIAIVTFKNGWHRGNCDYYPVIRWKKELRQSGFQIQFVADHKQPSLADFESVIIDVRYYRKTIGHEWVSGNKGFVADFMEQCRARGQRVILHDNSDSSGSREFDLIEHSDKFLKKQVWRDRSFYTRNMGFKSYMPWIHTLDGEPSEHYAPCPPGQLQKITLGWNIGMSDYRPFWFGSQYPFGTARLLNRVYRKPRFTPPQRERKLDTVFRGRKGSRPNYSEQRNRVMEILADRDQQKCLVGGKVSKRKYLAEVRNSKTCVSPFGWGEICFRDFESVISGAVLTKPDMSHVETWPSLFESGVTYVPFQWDSSDLNEKLDWVLSNYQASISIATKAQEVYIRALSDFPGFLSIVRQFVN